MIYNQSGEILLSTPVYLKKSETFKTINLPANIAAGNYIVKVADDMGLIGALNLVVY